MNIINYSKNILNFLDNNQINDEINYWIQYIKANNPTKIILLANGGSLAIVEHIATDLNKTTDFKALCNSNLSTYSCFSNDYGHDLIYVKFLEKFLESTDLLIAVSSSGESMNIINGCKFAKEQGAKIFCLSGFDENNSLNKLSKNFIHIPSNHYNYIENCHQIILTYLVDSLVKQ